MSQLQTFFNAHKPKSTPGVIALAMQQTDAVTSRTPASIALDLCCGAGTLTALAAERGYRAYGLDITAQYFGHDADQQARFMLADMNAPLPFRDGCAEIVYCIDSFQYAARPADLLAEVWRVLKPGGTFIFSTQNNYNPAGIKRHLLERIGGRPWSPWLVHPIENHVTYPWLMRALAERGFTIEYVRGLQFLTAWISLLPAFVRNTSPWRNKPWRSAAGFAQRVRLPSRVEESALARFAMIVFIRARKPV